MGRMTDHFTQLDETERRVFVLGATAAYRDTMIAISHAYKSGGLDKAFTEVRDGFNELCALIAAEGIAE